ncbi:MAG: single-stranded-DNA-specific exonuclease RecJ [Bdellovibrionota bacterium]
MSWRIREEAVLKSGLTPADLEQALSLPRWIAVILHHRMRSWGDQSLDAVKRFLEPSLKFLPDPFSLPDMDRGAERLAEAITEGQKIAVYGDYDVDGTVGSAVLRRFLRRLGVEPTIYQPDRQKEGYGINRAAVERLAEEGHQLMIAVDCGITSVAEVERANELGMDVIICDHHEPKEVLPPAYAVLDHRRSDNESVIQSLSGAGVAFYLAIATRSMLRDIGHFDPENGSVKEPDIRELLDLVALAAVADMVPLVDENRILLKAGLDKMRKNPNLGIRELLRVADIKPEDVAAYHLGFVLGPRINASGRLGSANGAMELLTTDDPEEARALAEKLHGVNAERIDLQNAVVDEALAQAALKIEANPEIPALVLVGDEWHEGVIGIVASKVVERYQRPVAMITFATHTGLGKGSVRGIPRLDMFAAMEAGAAHLKGFGGHKAAAGLSLERGALEAFTATFVDAIGDQASELTEGKSRLLPREVVADLVLENDDALTAESVAMLDRLAPFGIGNAEPVVVVSGWKIAGSKTLKERHLKIQFTTQQNKSLEGFWANGSGRLSVPEQSEVDIICLPQINSFRNLNRLELKIKDIRAARTTQ